MWHKNPHDWDVSAENQGPAILHTSDEKKNEQKKKDWEFLLLLRAKKTNCVFCVVFWLRFLQEAQWRIPKVPQLKPVLLLLLLWWLNSEWLKHENNDVLYVRQYFLFIYLFFGDIKNNRSPSELPAE